MSDTVKIKISSEADTSGFDKLNAQLEKSDKAAHAFVETLKMGVGIDLGGEIVRRISDIPRVLAEAAQAGVHFNASMETARLTIAGMVQQFSGGTVKDFNQALGVSDRLLQRMRESANELGISFEDFVETYKTTAGALFNSGVTDLEKQLELTRLLMRATASMGISGFMATRDIQDVFTGMAERTKFGRELGFKNEDIKAAEEAGRTFEYVSEKLSGFSSAGAAGLHTFTAELQRAENLVQQMLGELAQPLNDEIARGMRAFVSELEKPEVVATLKALGFELADMVKTGAGLINWAIRNADALARVAHIAEVAGAAFTAMGIARLVQGLYGMASAWDCDSQAVERETLAVQRNTTALEQNAVAARTARGASYGGQQFAAGLLPAPGRSGPAGLMAPINPWNNIRQLTAEEAAAMGISSRTGGGVLSTEVSSSLRNVGTAAVAGGIIGGDWQSALKFATAQGLLEGISKAGLPGQIAAAALAAGAALGSWIDGKLRASSKADADAAKEAAQPFQQLSEMIGSATSANKEQLARRIDLEERYAKGDLTSDNEQLRASAKGRLSVLDDMRARLEVMAEVNDKAAAKENEAADAAERKADAERRSAEQAQIAASWNDAAKGSARDWQAIMEQNESDPMKRLEMRQQFLRQQVPDVDASLLGIDKSKVTSTELMGAADRAIDVRGHEMLRDLAKELATTERQILDTRTQSEKKAKEEADRAKEENDKREQAVKLLHLEQQITEASIRGDERKKIELEAQKKLLEEQARLRGLGLPEAEVNAEAEKTAELSKQLQLKQLSARADQLDELKPSFGSELTTRGGRGARLRSQAREDYLARVNRDIDAAGLTGDDAEAARFRKMSGYDQARLDATGRIGGSTGFANANNNIGGGLGIGPSADFLSLKPIGEQVQTSPVNAPAAVDASGAKSDGGGSKLDGPANQTQTAAQQTQQAAQKVAASVGQIAQSVQAMARSIEDLKNRVAAVETNQGGF